MTFTVQDYQTLVKERDGLRAKLESVAPPDSMARRIVDLNAEVESLRAKLDASERAAAEMREALIQSRLAPNSQVTRGFCDRVLASDAGRDYVPKAEVDSAWRSAIDLCDGYPALVQLLSAARDANAPTSAPPRQP